MTEPASKIYSAWREGNAALAYLMLLEVQKKGMWRFLVTTITLGQHFRRHGGSLSFISDIRKVENATRKS